LPFEFGTPFLQVRAMLINPNGIKEITTVGHYERNEIIPCFFKVSQLNILIVGGGNVWWKKNWTFMLKSVPHAK